MGDNVNIGEGLIITGFSMVVVFIALIVISILIGALRKIGAEKKKEIVEASEVCEASEASVRKHRTVKDQVDIIDDEELVAVIAAAIAASMGVSVLELNIRTIKRISQNTPSWAVAGRGEQMSGRL